VHIYHARRLAQLSSIEREAAITHAHQALTRAQDVPSKIGAWRLMRRLILSRTPAEIAQLERARGLVKHS
jgi:hypothetical protein